MSKDIKVLHGERWSVAVSGKSHLQIIADMHVAREAADEEIERLLLVREQAIEFVRYFAERHDKAACDLLERWGVKLG